MTGKGIAWRRPFLLLSSALQRMESFLQLWQSQWSGYPDWIVFSALAVCCVLALWLVIKLLALAIKLVVIGTLLCIVFGVLIHFLG